LTDQINPTIVVDYSNSVGISGDIAIYYLDTISHQPIPAKDSFEFFLPGVSWPGHVQSGFRAGKTLVKSMPQYRTRLLLDNGNNQINEVNLLFSRYNY
jgi:hypothetical protein